MMDISAEMVKELRGRMRGRRAFVVLTAYLMVLSGGISLAFLPLASRSLGSGYDLAVRQYVGKGIFGLAVLLQFITISFIAPGITAGAIASKLNTRPRHPAHDPALGS
jgi:hypothetical protein